MSDDETKKAEEAAKKAEEEKKEEEAKKQAKAEGKPDPEKFVDREEFKKVIEKRDAVKAELRTLKSKMEEYEGTGDELQKLKDQVSELNEIKQEYESIKQEKEDADLEKKTGAEKETIKIRKDFDALQKQMDTKLDEFNKSIEIKDNANKALKGEVSNLRGVKLENEILAAAGTYNAINPNQIVRLIKSDFTYDETDNSFYKNVYKGDKLKDQIEVADFVKEFLSDKENANLVKSGMKAGSGSKSNSNSKTSGDSVSFERESEMYPSKSELTDALTDWGKAKGFKWDDEENRKYITRTFNKFGDKMFKLG